MEGLIDFLSVREIIHQKYGWLRFIQQIRKKHYRDVIMTTMAPQITSLTIVYSIVYSDAAQRKYQSSASLALVWGIHQGPVNSPHIWPVTRKMFSFDDVIMIMDLLGKNLSQGTSGSWFTKKDAVSMGIWIYGMKLHWSYHNTRPNHCVWACIDWDGIWTHYGLLTPYGDIGLDQYRQREWLVVWRHEDTTKTNVNLSSVRYSGIRLTGV